MGVESFNKKKSFWFHSLFTDIVDHVLDQIPQRQKNPMQFQMITMLDLLKNSKYEIRYKICSNIGKKKQKNDQNSALFFIMSTF